MLRALDYKVAKVTPVSDDNPVADQLGHNITYHINKDFYEFNRVDQLFGHRQKRRCWF